MVKIDLPSAWYDFEKNYPHFDVNKVMVQYRWVSIVMGAAYLVLLFVGRRMMRNREPFSIRFRNYLKFLTTFFFLIFFSKYFFSFGHLEFDHGSF